MSHPNPFEKYLTDETDEDNPFARYLTPEPEAPAPEGSTLLGAAKQFAARGVGAGFDLVARVARADSRAAQAIYSKLGITPSGDDPALDLAEWAQQMGERTARAAGAPKGTAEQVAGVAGVVGANASPYIAGGELFGLGVLGLTPITAASEAGSTPEQSLVGTVGRLTGSTSLQRVSQSAAGRAVAGVASDLLTAGLLEGAGKGAQRLARRWQKPSLDEAADAVLRETGAEGPKLLPSGQYEMPAHAGPAAPPTPAEQVASVERETMIGRAVREDEERVATEAQARLDNEIIHNPQHAVTWSPDAATHVERMMAQEVRAGRASPEGVASMPAATQAERVAEAAPTLAKQAEAGGFSFDPRFGADVQDGYAVGLGNDEGVVSIHTPSLTPEEIRRVVDENADLFEQDPSVVVGGWRDNAGVYHIEPSRIMRDPDEAFLAGVEKRQQGIGDLRVYHAGGDGYIATDTPDALKVADLMQRVPGMTRESAEALLGLERRGLAGGVPQEGESALPSTERGGTGGAVGEPGTAEHGPGLPREALPDEAGPAGSGEGVGPGGEAATAHPRPLGAGEAPETLDNLSAGFIAPHALLGLGSAPAGALYGAHQGTTPEEHRRNAILYGVGALLVGGVLGAKLLRTPDAERVGTGLADPAVQGVLKSVAAAGKEAPKTGLWAKIERAYQQVLDAHFGLGQYGRIVGGTERVEHEATRASGWSEAALGRLEEDFTPVVQAAKGIEPQVAALATAERALELAANGMPNKGVDLVQAARARTVLSQVPAVRQATDLLRRYYRQLLDARLENGLISRAQYQAIVAKGEYYVPFVRDFTDELTGGSGFGARGLAQRGRAVRRMTAEQAVSQIKNPFEQAVADTYLTERAIARQRVTNVVVDLYDENPEAARLFLHEIPNGQTARGGETVVINHRGEQRTFAVVDEPFYDAWATLAPASQDFAGKFLGFFKHGLTRLVTIRPLFAARNFVRDQVFTATAYPLIPSHLVAGGLVGAGVGATVDPNNRMEGAILGGAFGVAGGHMLPHALRTVAALGDMIGERAGVHFGNRDLYDEWLREGGSGFGFFPRTPQDAQRVIQQLQDAGHLDPTDLINPVSWWHALSRINQAIEEAPRLAYYKYLKAQGADIPEAIAGSRDVSLDFSRIGSGRTIRFAAGATAFLNPKLQGWDKLFRLFVADRNAAGQLRFGAQQLKSWALGATALTAPTVALWQINKDNPEYWRRPLWERNLFWLVPKSDGSGFWKIPKPFELGYLFASIPERFLDYLHTNQRDVLDAAMKDMGTNTVGSIDQWLPTAVAPLVQNLAGTGGYNFFLDRPVVSEREQNLPPELQYTDRTSSVARAVGRATGVSPEKIDNAIYGYTGSLGQTATGLVTEAARATGLDDRGPSSVESPSVMQGLSTNPHTEPEPVSRFYDTFHRLEQLHNGLVTLNKGHDPARRREYVEEHREDLRAYERLKGRMNALRAMQQAQHRIEQSRTLPEDEKATRLQALREREAALADHALTSLRP